MVPALRQLTGRPDGAVLAPPADLFDTLGFLGDALGLDAVEAVTVRAALMGLTRGGDRTAGGAGRLLRTADGWIALSLARPDDLGALDAWLGSDGLSRAADPWEALAAVVAVRPTADLLERAGWLGLPAAAVGETVVADGPVVGRHLLGPAPSCPLAGLRVVDTSSLWAGPLCAKVLEGRGAQVVKLESVHRPDGARLGAPEFWAWLHAGQEERRHDVRTTHGLAAFRAELAGADVVIEGARPRAFEQLGIDPLTLLAEGGPRVWVSITAHGRFAAPERVGFGDDAAAAGGLVAWDDAGPCFVGDAIADPLTGLFAALAAVESLERGGRWLLDAALARTAAFSSGARGTRSPHR